ncbi:hypothetical protein J6590_030189 [Homalodisca vitripennis]|nr:hypothetical protein J6590_030189 [Homalodisca vitripennis]
MCSNGSAHTRARRAAQPRPPRNNSAARTLGRSRAEFVPLGRRGAARRVYSVRRQRNRFLAAVTFGCLRTTSAIVGKSFILVAGCNGRRGTHRLCTKLPQHLRSITPQIPRQKREVELLERDRRTIEPTQYV